MNLNGYTLEIPGETESDGYVHLNNGDQYKIKLTSIGYKSHDVDLSIDGKEIATFRLSPGGILVLERPTNDNGKFTFYTRDSVEGKEIGLGLVRKDDLGLISATFTPEKPSKVAYVILPTPWNPYPYPHPRPYRPIVPFYPKVTWGTSINDNLKSFSHEGMTVCCNSVEGTNRSGGTGLSGISNQKFVDAAKLELDHENAVTLFLRLVEKPQNQKSPRKLLANTHSKYPEPI